MRAILPERLTVCQAMLGIVAHMADEPKGASPVAHREGPATAKRAQVQEQVLTATERLLSEGASYAELNVERIARAAGISRTAFYFYFKDKRDLLMRLAGDISDELYRQADIWFSGDGDPETEIREALTEVLALYDEHGALIRAVVEVATYDEEIARFWRRLLTRYVDATQRRIEEQGTPVPPRATAFGLIWMVERTYYEQLVHDEPIPADELISALSGVFLRTIYAR
jgi:TetR/AcrR family transcriptional regulator, ethionamide resistance regulator